ncbi:MAG: MFS transporter, partial [Deltaproteobacteria bacterium]|nr:MFS transporter [Deltaproteobacteria bacterium]
VALVFFEKDALRLTPAEVAEIAFWLGLPWGTKMVAGVASDAYPIFGSRRKAYLLLGSVCSLCGYLALATVIETKGAFLIATLMVTVGFMIQDVVADALSVEIAEDDAELGQIQALGRMALLVGGISVGYLGGWLAGRIGARGVFAVAMVLPLIVAGSVSLIPRRTRPAKQETDASPLGGHKPGLIMGVGLGYASFGVLLQIFEIPLTQEIVLIVSGALIGLLLRAVGISRPVAIAALVIFLFRSTPGVGQGYSYWAIDRLGFDQEFLGLLAQVSSVLSLVGLIVFRKAIVERPVSFTLFWVVLAGTILYLPSIGLFYGVNEWLGMSPRVFAFIDTTISAPLGQLTMVPILILIARSAPPGAEATMFSIMASLMNLALSASELFTRYLNTVFAVTQQDYSNLGKLMITVGLIGLLPLFALPLLRRVEKSQPPEGRAQ